MTLVNQHKQPNPTEGKYRINMKDLLDILIAKLAIWSIKRGYGANCKDYANGCAGCEAKKIINWLEDHIKLIRF